MAGASRFPDADVDPAQAYELGRHDERTATTPPLHTEAVLTCWRGARGRPGLRQFVVRHDEGLGEVLDFANELRDLYDSIEIALYVDGAINAFVWDWRRHLWEGQR